ncbi:16S rRNA (uracil(1498)-N(3))-methyltransferase [Hoylesella shahii]|jgi:RNA methyltransferase, rsmE family|uniref:Ribosomal RNA small subunit methyltransferase E n=1 Tax=Hoylesella shahii DSM 15611 = JCM 12083 TaxID=1122991 RepID=A0A318I5D5_9BACT|nr:16S rRNA (uracil(1498)-N(3))-methyltransferase [Hoylesella shahii]PXX24450.1 16S rRNA (uracil1498-N3)-methyltransferase [Hoylesella shahii DSM 15611 = JCM 12083]
MKETRYFYVPNAAHCNELPDEEASHASRVLRLESGDEVFLIDGEGCFFKAQLTLVTKSRCLYNIVERLPQEKTWSGRIAVGMAPTKSIDRVEWTLEKATEIGLDEFSLLNCAFSERRNVKLERLDKIVVAAVKQSRKAWKPQLNDLLPFERFVKQPRKGAKFIAHCYDEIDKKDLYNELLQLNADEDVTILIGPEGDFSFEEVRLALDQGYVSVSLGKSRLRTETAALSATMIAQLAFRK